MKYQEFIEKINFKYKGVLSVIDIKEFYSYRDKINVLCKLHGKYKIRYDHLLNYGCKKCSKIRKNDEKLNKLIEKCKLIHNSKYDYSKSVYSGNRKKIIITCPTHGDFLMTPFNHCISKQGCKYCNYILTTDDFIERSNKIHKNRYDYSKSVYCNDRVKIEIICKKHGSFFQRPSSHYTGNGCPTCRQSTGEKLISEFLDENFIKYEQQKKFIDCKNKLQLKFDFYISDFNIIIEYDGIQHYKPIEFFGGQQRFNYELKLRNIKENYCEKNGIKLIKISYNDNINDILINLISSEYVHNDT